MATADSIRWLPWILMGFAAAAAWVFAHTEAEAAQCYAAGVFGASLGSALLLWGIEELKDGKISGKRVRVRRSTSPLVFLAMVVGMRFFPGFAMLLGAFWYVFLRQT